MASQRQSTRIANFGATEDTEENGSTPAPDVTHSRCDVVELVISDQRPAETQFRENDFLDTEPSGDDEYQD